LVNKVKIRFFILRLCLRLRLILDAPKRKAVAAVVNVSRVHVATVNVQVERIHT